MPNYNSVPSVAQWTLDRSSDICWPPLDQYGTPLLQALFRTILHDQTPGAQKRIKDDPHQVVDWIRGFRSTYSNVRLIVDVNDGWATFSVDLSGVAQVIETAQPLSQDEVKNW